MSHKSQAQHQGSGIGSMLTPLATDPHAIRNVVLVGHTGAGKTTLVEAILAATGATPRAGSVAEGTTVTDSDPSAIKQQRSVSMSVAPLSFDDIKINLIDTPGFGDFVGELRAGLRAADAALFVVSAVDGVDAATIALWHECAAVAMPRAIVITQLDRARADFDATVAICRRVFGDGVAAIGVPVHDDEADNHPMIGVLDLLGQQISDYRDDQFPPAHQPLEAQHEELVAEVRGTLIEAVIAESEDETLLDRYLAGDLGQTADDNALLTADIATAVGRGSFFPVLPAEAVARVGMAEILGVIVEGFRSPAGHEPPVIATVDGSPLAPFATDPAGPLVGEVIKTTLDPYVGRVSLIRLFSGTLHSDDAVHVSGHGLADRGHPDHDSDDRPGRLYSPFGAELREVSFCIAGDICAFTKMSAAQTGDTLSAKDHPMLIAPWPMPEPLLPIAVVAASRSDEDALAKNLAKLIGGDVTVRLDRATETGQLVLWCMGQAHADVLLDRLRTGGVELTTEPVRIPLRETFAKPAKGHGRHVKQSGGHGQYAVCDIEVEPLPRGGGIQFSSHIVGGVISQQFVASVEKGIRAAAHRGPTGYPLVDFAVRLVDGKMHSVDSSDAAFQAAGSAALRDAAAAGGSLVLEPIDTIIIRTTDGYLGPILSDIATRRGRVINTEPGEDLTVITAELPQEQLVDYPTALRSLSSGTATFTRSFARYEPR